MTEHLESYFEHVREHHERGLPKYIEQDRIRICKIFHWLPTAGRR